MVRIFAIRAGEHGNRIASEVLVKASGRSTAADLLVHGHGVVFVEKAGVELSGVSCGELLWWGGSYHSE